MKEFVRKTAAMALVALMALQAPAEAATYFYYRGGAQAGQQTGSPPASPAAPGVFAILVDGPDPDVAIKGQSYSATTYAYSNAGQVVFAVQSGSLPAGLSINSTTGTISGTPTTVGSSSFTIQGVDTANGRLATDSRTLDTVDAFSITATPATSVIAGNAYSASFTLAGGGQPYSFAATGLPSGLSISSGAAVGTVSGASSAVGGYQVVVTGSEVHGLAVTYPYTLNVVSPLAIVGLPPGTGTVAVPYSGQVAVSGGLAPYSYSVVAGQLPNGVSLKPTTGVVSGTPTTAGTKSGIKIKVTDASGQSFTSAAFSITIAAAGNQSLSINAVPVTTATESQIYSTQWFAGGGTTPYVYSLAPGSGPLPAGLTLNGPTGIISGSPTLGSAGTYPNIIVQVRDALGAVAVSSPYTLTVLPNHPLAISGSPGGGQVAIPYAYQFNAVGGSETGYVYTLGTGTLPPGLVVQQNGLLTGVPTTAGTYSFKVRVTDSAAATALTSTLNVVVAPTPPLVISGNPPTSATVGQSYLATWTAFDGSGSGYHFASVGNPLPPGLTLSEVNGAQATLSGSPTVSGSYSGLQIKVTDSLGQTATSNVFSIIVGLPPLVVSGSAPSGASLGQPYSAQFSAAGGSGTGYVWSVFAGTLPPGLTLNSASGAISGSPVNVGTYSGIVLKVVDSLGQSAVSQSFSIAVSDANPLSVSWNPQTSWQPGDAFVATPAASGGIPADYVWTHSGALPPGVVQNPATGELAGTATGEGTYGPVTVTVSDGLRSATTAPATFIVGWPTLTIAGNPSSSASLGQPYSAQFTADGGDANYSFSIQSGSLPPGLALSSSGAISGSPTSVGTFPAIAVKVVDTASHAAVSQTFQIVVTDAAPLTVSWSPQTSWHPGDSFAAQPTASGGKPASYVWSVTGSLPPGVVQNPSTGALAGTLSAVGSYGPVTITVNDGLRTATTTPATFVVAWPTLAIAGSPAASAPLGQSYSAQFTASGGDTHYVFSLAGNALPPGLTLDPASGAISGTASTAGTYSGIVVRVVDTAGASAQTQPFSIDVVNASPLSVSWAPQTSWTTGQAFTAVPTASGGNVGAYRWSVQGQLPAIVTQNTSTGALAGTLRGAGTYGPITITVTDGVQTAVTDPQTFQVDLPPLLLSGAPAQTATENVPYSATFLASGGDGTYVWSIDANSLPPGLGLGQDGVLSGTPASGSAGWYWISSVQVSDASGNMAWADPFELVVSAGLSIAANAATNAGIGQPYAASFTVTGGTGPYGFTVAGLPVGLTFQPDPDGTATISGAVPTYGAYPIVVTASDSAGATAPYAYTLTVTDPFAIAGDPATHVYVGDAYSAQFTATGGAGGPYTYYQASGELPPGLAIDPDSGLLSGTAGGWGGSYDVEIGAFDSQGNVSTIAFSIFAETRPLPPLTVTGTPDPNMTVGVSYSDRSIVASGGNLNPAVCYDFHMAIGPNLPAGIMAVGDRDHLWITGTPALWVTPGTYGPYQAYVRDACAGGIAYSEPFTLTVSENVPSGPLTVHGTLVDGILNNPSYQVTFTATGGAGEPYSYALAPSSEPLPPGLQIYNDVSIGQAYVYGTPSAVGTFTGIVMRVTDGGGNVADSAPMTVNIIAPPLKIDGRPDTEWSTRWWYEADFWASGGNGGPYTFSLLSPLPEGLTFDTMTGTLSGLFAQGGTYPVSIQVTDGVSIAAYPAFSIVVHDPLTITTDADQTPQKVGTRYTAHYVAHGGYPRTTPPPYTYQLSAYPSMPPGLGFNVNTGTLSGTLTQAGVYTVGVTAQDGQFQRAYVDATITVVGPLVLTGVPEAQATLGRYYASTKPIASGGTGGNVFAIDQGQLPPGLALRSDGRISGTPTAVGTYGGIVIRATDNSGDTATTVPFSITVNVPPVPIGQLEVNLYPATPLTVPINQPMPQLTAIAAGGSGNYTYTVVPVPQAGGGVLPSGTVLTTGAAPANGSTTPVGMIGGVPDALGSYPFAIKVTDNVTLQERITKPGSITVSQAAVFMADQDIETGKIANVPATVYGTGPFTFGKGGGMLPPGTNISSASGSLGGIPTVPGKYVFTITVADLSTGATSESSPVTIEVEAVTRECDSLNGGYFGPAGTVGNPRYRPLTSAVGSRIVADGTDAFDLQWVHTPFSEFVDYFTGKATVGKYVGNAIANGTSCLDGFAMPMEIVPPLQVQAPSTLHAATHVQPYGGDRVSATGGKQGGSYRYLAFNLPPGLTMHPDGTISGTPGPQTAGNTYAVTVMVMDEYGFYDSTVTSLQVD